MADSEAESMGRKSKTKRSGCLAVFLVILVLPLLWYNLASTKVDKENRHRTYICKQVVAGIKAYYRQHGEYPADLSELQMQYGEVVDDFITAGVLEYDRDASGGSWFSLTCRFSGILASGSGKYRLSWSGIQYSNRKDALPLSPGSDIPPDEDGFYFADFH